MTDDDKAMYRSAVVTGNLDEFAILYKDAARYRWLRGRDLDAIVEGGIFAGMVPDNLVVNGEDLDREIDAAMLKTQNA